MSTVSGDNDAVIHLHGKTPADLERLTASMQGAKLSEHGCRLASFSSEHSPRFDCGAFLSRLQTTTTGRCLIASAAMPSTQSLLFDNAAALPEGTACVSDVQTSGRGRGGNTWTSPEGCLMFSFTARLTDGRTLPLLQYVVTLAIVEAVQGLAAEALGPEAAAAASSAAAAASDRGAMSARFGPSPLDLRIKWPNDVYAAGLKVGGVLCQSSYADGAFLVTVGVGLNVTNEQPSTCVAALLATASSAAAAAAAAAGAPPPPPPGAIAREAFLAAIFARYEALAAVFAADGFGPLQPAYLHHWLHSRQPVTLVEAGAEVKLTVTGLTRGGYLAAVDGDGAEFELHPDGNSLDFFQGLVRKKLN